MRSCLQCRAVTSREGRIWNLHSLLLYSHGRSFDDPRTAHTQDSMIKRERSPSFTFFSPFFWFSLWSRPFRFQRMWRRITSSSFRGRIDPLDGLPLEILCSLSLFGFHLTFRFWGFVLASFHSVPISGPLFRTRSKQDFLCTRYHETRLHTL